MSTNPNPHPHDLALRNARRSQLYHALAMLAASRARRFARKGVGNPSVATIAYCDAMADAMVLRGKARTFARMANALV